MISLAFVLLLLLQHQKAVQAEVISQTQNLPSHGGEIRVHYNDNEDAALPCQTVVLMGVGTAMSVENYDQLSLEVMQRPSPSGGIVMIILDHNPGSAVKYEAEKYATAVNEIMTYLPELVPVCQNVEETESTRKIVIGGHSASGEASLTALVQQLYTTSPHGFLGLDPFDVTSVPPGSISIPALYWGFSKTTCMVSVSKAAKEAYERTQTSSRVMFQVLNEDDIIEHCIFTDRGCPMCRSLLADDWVHGVVAHSIAVFGSVIHPCGGGEVIVDKEAFSGVVGGHDVGLFVNEDVLPADEELVFS